MNMIPAEASVDLKRGVDYIGVCCPFYCHDGRGRLLLHKRSKNCRDEIGRWDCGGGSVEFGESFEEAVVREIKEEYGATPKSLKFCGTSNVLRENSGTPTHWVAMVFAAEVDPAEVRIMEPEKVDEIGWFTVDALPDPLHSMMERHLRIVREAGVDI